MTPESIAFIVLTLCILGGAGLLIFGGWLIRHDLTRGPGAATSRVTQDLRPLQDIVVDFFARSEPAARVLNVLAAHRDPLTLDVALRKAKLMATRDRNDRAPHSISESIPIWMMRLAGLVKLTKEGVLITNAGREVHRRIITPPPSLDEQKPRRDSGYDSLFIPVPIDNSGSGHLQRVREALRRSERNFIEASSATVLSGIGELRATKSPTKPTNLETMQTRPMNKRNITMTAADHEELTYAIAATGKLSERGRGEMSALEAELSRAAIVDAKDLPTDVITMNSRAELLDLDTGERMEFTLVFPRDAHIEDGKISVLAPLGTAMLGYRVGDEFTWTVPYGMRRLKVTAVQFQPEAALAMAA